MQSLRLCRRLAKSTAIRSLNGGLGKRRSLSTSPELLLRTGNSVNSSQNIDLSGFDKDRALEMLNGEHLREGQAEPDFGENKIVFYNMRFCVFAQRTALALLAKEIDFRVVNIFLSDRPEWFKSLTPANKVPVLKMGSGDTTVIFESLLTLEYLDEAFPETRRMQRDSLEQRTRDKAMVEQAKKFYGSMNRSVRKWDSRDIARLQEVSLGGLDVLEQELRERTGNNRYFQGNDYPGFLDFVIWPWFERLPAFGVMMSKSVEDLLPKDRFPELTRWIEEMHSDPVVSLYRLSHADHMKFFDGFRERNAPYNLIYDRMKASA